MNTHFDHVTVVVNDLERAKAFFGALGFKHGRSVVISGERFSRYILKYHRPLPPADPEIANLGRLGYNHLCFAVDSLDAALQQLGDAGFPARGDVLDFRGRKLVYVSGPEGITVELSERHA